MSVFTPKRVFLVVVSLLLASAAFGANPSPRTIARMAFDEREAVGVLFGGRAGQDPTTRLTPSTDETWLWTGSRWVQRFPAHKPDARGAHTMIYDSVRARVLLFGGRQEVLQADSSAVPIFFNDLWAWKDGDWTKLETAEAPSSRFFAGMAFDPLRDRAVLFGGTGFAADGKTVQTVFDTWEFDGSQWQLVPDAGSPKVVKPLLVWDGARNEILMVGIGETGATAMYRYIASTRKWEVIAPAKIPPCGNEGNLAYQNHNGKVIYFGGLCSGTSTPTGEDFFEWDGTNWTEITVSEISRAIGQATAYDTARRKLTIYGGVLLLLTAPRSTTQLYANGTIEFQIHVWSPAPRSLSTMSAQPSTDTVWLYGGLDETTTDYLQDFWGYRSGQWFLGPAGENRPATCANPLSAFDGDRNKLVLVCAGSTVYEFDGAAWKSFTPKNTPAVRRFAALAYDAQLKKTVLFGGFDGKNYRNDTWTWDGTNWTEVKNDRPTHRGLMSMWYDPLAKKTIIYGGVGLENLDSDAVRYDDMWSFNGSGWTKMSVSSTPGARMGAQTAVDPRDGKVLLFGGLLAVPISEEGIEQRFNGETWQWNGAASSWTKLNPAVSPAARQNGSMVFDPASERILLFGGYSGLYYSDLWSWDGETWSPLLEFPKRRRSASTGTLSTPASESIPSQVSN